MVVVVLLRLPFCPRGDTVVVTGRLRELEVFVNGKRFAKGELVQAQDQIGGRIVGFVE